MTQHLNHPIVADLMKERQYQRLLHEHRKLEDEIALEQAGPVVDWLQVKKKKVEKLHVADRLELMRRQVE